MDTQFCEKRVSDEAASDDRIRRRPSRERTSPSATSGSPGVAGAGDCSATFASSRPPAVERPIPADSRKQGGTRRHTQSRDSPKARPPRRELAGHYGVNWKLPLETAFDFGK
jgi:hypothetical protein